MYFRKTNKNRSERGDLRPEKRVIQMRNHKVLSTPEQTSEDGEEDRVVDIVDDNGKGRI